MPLCKFVVFNTMSSWIRGSRASLLVFLFKILLFILEKATSNTFLRGATRVSDHIFLNIS